MFSSNSNSNTVYFTLEEIKGFFRDIKACMSGKVDTTVLETPEMKTFLSNNFNVDIQQGTVFEVDKGAMLLVKEKANKNKSYYGINALQAASIFDHNTALLYGIIALGNYSAEQINKTIQNTNNPYNGYNAFAIIQSKSANKVSKACNDAMQFLRTKGANTIYPNEEQKMISGNNETQTQTQVINSVPVDTILPTAKRKARATSENTDTNNNTDNNSKPSLNKRLRLFSPINSNSDEKETTKSFETIVDSATTALINTLKKSNCSNQDLDDIRAYFKFTGSSFVPASEQLESLRLQFQLYFYKMAMQNSNAGLIKTFNNLAKIFAKYPNHYFPIKSYEDAQNLKNSFNEAAFDLIASFTTEKSNNTNNNTLR